MIPERPSKRDAKCIDGGGSAPGSIGACAISSCDFASSTSSDTRFSPSSVILSLRRAYASCHFLRAAPARHREAELFLGSGGRELAGDATLVDDEDAVGERQD